MRVFLDGNLNLARPLAEPNPEAVRFSDAIAQSLLSVLSTIEEKQMLPSPFKTLCQRRRKNASIFRNKNTSAKLARRAGNLGPFPRGSGLRPFIRRGVGTGAA
jgi:hypothetical protein